MTQPPSSERLSPTEDLDALRRRLAGAHAVLSLARKLPTAETIEVAVRLGLDAVASCLPLDGAMVAERVGDSERLFVLDAIGLEGTMYGAGQVLGPHSVESAVVQSGRERISENLAAEPEPGLDPTRERVPRAGVVLPMQVRSRVVGTLTVSSAARRWTTPTAEEMLLLRAVADQLGVAMSGLRTRVDLVTLLEKIDALGRVAHALTVVEDADRTMRLVADEGMRVFGAERAGVFLIDRDTQQTVCMVAEGLSPRYVRAVEESAGSLRTTAATLKQQPVFLRQAKGRPGHPFGPEVEAEGYRSVALLPLVFAKETIGSLAFFHDRVKEYTSEERRLAVAFADQAALAIGKSRLLDQVSRVKREWQMAFDATGSGLAVSERDGRIVRANRFVADLAGVPVTGLPGLDLKTIFPQWPDPMGDPLVQAQVKGQPAAAMLDSRDGRLLVVTATPMPDERVVVAIDDLTDVVFLENRFRLVVETAHDAIVITGEDGAVTFANPAAGGLFGLPPEELHGQRLAELVPVPPEGAPPKPGVAHRYESQLQRPDGAPRQVAVSSAPLHIGEDASGRVAVMRDITQEYEAIARLRRSEERYRTLFTAAPLGIFTLDHTSRFLSVNHAALLLLGLESLPPEARLIDFVEASDRPAFQTHLTQSLAGHPTEFIVRVRRTDGLPREAAVVATPIAGTAGAGGAATVLAIARDVTDEFRLRERVILAEKMAALGQVVSGVAHELNNPIAGITALAQALILEEPLDDGTRRVLRSIRREADRAARIVSDLLTSSRQQPLARRDFDLNELVRETMAIDVEARGETDVTWDLMLGANLPPVSADPDQVRQVLSNLIGNATQAMESAPRKTGRVRTYCDTAIIGCEVIDSGPGIAADALGRVFEPFYSTKVVGKGTGLGLAISHGIIEAHGGEIHAENLPGGARFWFALPRHPGQAAR